MKGLLLLTGSFLLLSCAALPQIFQPAGPATQTILCPSPFLTEKTRLIHAIEVRTAGETKTVMIGVTLTDPSSRTISCALMSAEGVTFFEAASGPSGLMVSRALPPFDEGDFARNMMEDIELIFLAPPGMLTQKGVLAGGDQVCRWHNKQGGWVDVLSGPDGRMNVRRYSEGGGLKRSVRLAPAAAPPYSTIELQASELFDYTLMMTLIEAEAAKDEPQLTK
ncbi:MAG: hypothetical protein CVU71_15265 [Deltaproteobacteria bacterium HGW-Deltaproteobacteria-6]|nr:MAG: hypothetical protein CVU71_15265 [Deltaproteobacteria bacterium HGW-Deltaproteobacteria-6]